MQTLTRGFTRERILGVLCTTALLLVASLATAPPSDAGICENFGLSAKCRIVFGGEKSDGNDGGGKGPTRPRCNLGAPDYKRVSCEHAFAGIWLNEHQCYVRESPTQPEPGDPKWKSKGKFYTCMGYNDDGTELIIKEGIWFDEPPEGLGPEDLQEDLETAVGTKFRAMYPGLAPTPFPMEAGFEGARMAPIGLWVWMWPDAPFDSQWDPPRVHDPETGYMVDARVTHVKWDMGDGHTYTCGKSEPFMPYKRDRTPTCGHKYEIPGNYIVRVTTYWTIDYVDAQGPNTTNLNFDQSLWVRIGENQVVNK